MINEENPIIVGDDTVPYFIRTDKGWYEVDGLLWCHGGYDFYISHTWPTKNPGIPIGTGYRCTEGRSGGFMCCADTFAELKEKVATLAMRPELHEKIRAAIETTGLSPQYKG